LISEVKKNYHPTSLKRFVSNFSTQTSLSSKNIIITFDDGYRDNFLYAAPILKKYNVPATFFVTSGYIGTDKVFPWDIETNAPHPMMSWDEVRELNNMGFEIGAHTVNHADLGKISYEEAKKEINQAKDQIENELGQKIISFAVPFGKKENIRPWTGKLVKKAGFQCCCTAFGGKVTPGCDLFSLPRIPIYPTLLEVMMELDNFMIYYNKKMKINIFP
jgi:peptidoglycan/xylan/chitin deacetylase (PgdA/CDA1 family)